MKATRHISFTDSTIIPDRGIQIRIWVFCVAFLMLKKGDTDYTNKFDHPRIIICDALLDLVPFVQFKKREKRPWKSVTSIAGNFIQSNTLPWVFLTI